MPVRALAGQAGPHRIREMPGEGTAVLRVHRLAQHGGGPGQLRGNGERVQPEVLQDGELVPHHPFLDDLAAADQAVRGAAVHPLLARGRAVGPVAVMHRVVQHAVAADEAVRATLLPHHVVMAAAAVVEGGHALDRVPHDVVEPIGLAVGRVHLHLRCVVVAEVAQAAGDPYLVGPAGDVVAGVGVGCVGCGIDPVQLVVGHRVPPGLRFPQHSIRRVRQW